MLMIEKQLESAAFKLAVSKLGFSALQSTVVEEEEDGVIYTVVVKQQHAGPTSPLVSHVQ